MIRQLKKFTLQMVAGANIATILIMLVIGYSGYLNPVRHPMMANLGLTFPAFLLINMGFLVFWIIFRLKGAIIPIAGFLICYAPIRTFFPLNIPKDPPKGALKILSYNVWHFAEGQEVENGRTAILDYILQQHADIVCLQEASSGKLEEVDSMMKKQFPYQASADSPGKERLSIFSKYPILGQEKIDYVSKGNLSAAFKLDIEGDTVLVINNHLETTGLSIEDKAQFKNLIKGNLNRKESQHESQRLIDKLGKASAIRAPQAEAVARYIQDHKKMSIICCGDFNDGPLSYAHRTIAKGLTDCYVETGNGPGISYHRGGFYVRIDNIICSKDLKPFKCKVDTKISTSDHYPIYCWIKKRAKP